jgi:hypothetical protein
MTHFESGPKEAKKQRNKEQFELDREGDKCHTKMKILRCGNPTLS